MQKFGIWLEEGQSIHVKLVLLTCSDWQDPSQPWSWKSYSYRNIEILVWRGQMYVTICKTTKITGLLPPPCLKSDVYQLIWDEDKIFSVECQLFYVKYRLLSEKCNSFFRKSPNFFLKSAIVSFQLFPVSF